MVKAFAIMIWDNAAAFMDLVGKDVPKIAVELQLSCISIYLMGTGLCLFVLLIATQPEPCVFVEKDKYPNRPAPDSSGFRINEPSEPGCLRSTDWGVADQDIFTTNSSIRGWCNVDPAEGYALNVSFKECDCKYDGLWGRFCEVPVQSVCINQCSGHGHCRGGFCQNHHGLWSSLTLEFYKKACEHIMLQYPYWNTTAGKDHIWVNHNFLVSEGSSFHGMKVPAMLQRKYVIV